MKNTKSTMDLVDAALEKAGADGADRVTFNFSQDEVGDIVTELAKAGYMMSVIVYLSDDQSGK
jgi:hypothetical protein